MAIDSPTAGATSTARIFAENAVSMSRHGLAVIPLGRDRTPSVSGFNRWSHRPSERTLERWAAVHPNDNIGVIPGLSGVWVADVDDAEQVEKIQKNSRCDSAPNTDEPRIPSMVREAVRAPANHPSPLWAKRRSQVWERDCHRAPINSRKRKVLCVRRRQRLVGAQRTATSGCHQTPIDADRPKPETIREMRDGSRKLWLNDLLCSHAMHCDSEDELLDIARTANQNLGNRGIPVLDDATVVKRAAAVWKDAVAGKLEAWRGRSGNARARGSEIVELCRLDKNNGTDAFTLLMVLRIEHSARCRRGETFSITPKAMARDNVVPGWTRERYEKARNLLLLGRWIEKVADLRTTPEGRVAAQYRLTTHSIAGEAPITL